MYEGDRARKRSLVDYGFRLPSCFDNRPLTFSEFESLMPPCIYVSATPGPYEKEKASQIVEQIIRPTGLVDPPLHVLPTAGFVQDLVARIKERIRRGERVLVTTLTKRMAEDFADYLCTMGLNVRYLHSEIQTLERVKILQDLRAGNFDVLVGINLLREGIDLPEVSLVAILDADKEGFLRSQTSLIQIAGRTARHIDGEVILYADTVTASMQGAIAETERRRKRQIEYNEKHNIKPSSIQKPIKSTFTDEQIMKKSIKVYQKKVEGDVRSLIKELEQQMKEAALRLAFEEAAILRDQILSLKEKLKKKAS
jgi:excinuclease ABC subunit B